MSYFSNFPKVDYRFGNSRNVNGKFTNLSVYADILDQIQDESTAYRLYTVMNGERPDVVSDTLYNTTDYYWTFLLLNPKIRESGWPLSQKELIERLEIDVPGECLVFFGQETNPSTQLPQHEIIGKFDIGCTIFGSVSGAAGIVYARNPLLGQIFVRKTNNIPFERNERVVDSLQSAPDSFLDVNIVHSPAYTAIRHVEDGDGHNVDVDYTVDFRGIDSEGDMDIQGGVFGDAENPDIYADSSPYKTVTFLEYYRDLNNDQSQIRVLRKEVADQIPSLLKRTLTQ